MNKHERGKQGEDLVAKHLKYSEFEIIARNFHSRFGEIDIIAANQELILFVEVKSRKIGSMVSPAEAVSESKIKKISLTADVFLEKHSEYSNLQPRFDVAAVIYIKNKPNLNYIENAFEASCESQWKEFYD